MRRRLRLTLDLGSEIAAEIEHFHEQQPFFKNRAAVIQFLLEVGLSACSNNDPRTLHSEDAAVMMVYLDRETKDEIDLFHKREPFLATRSTAVRILLECGLNACRRGLSEAAEMREIDRLRGALELIATRGDLTIKHAVDLARETLTSKCGGL